MLPRFLRRFVFPLASLLPPLAGCSELVALGSECPVGDKVCAALRNDGGVSVPDVDQPSALRDAGVGARSDGAVRDARAARPSDDGGLTTPTTLARLEVGNGAFSLVTGKPGDVTAVSLATITGIQPWFTCQPIGGGPNVTTAVRAENMVTLGNGETAPGDVVFAPNATDASDPNDTFVSIRHLVTLVDLPLLQALPEPLRQGQRYAVAIDVRTGNTDALLSLQLRGGNVGDSCVGATGQTTLAETDPITRTGWHTVCLPFTAPVEYTHLVLSVKSNLVTDARLFLDNLRNATSKDCPAL
jgi:hypothetical protein